MSGWWASGGKAVSLALFFKKFGGEWSYKTCFIICLFFVSFCFGASTWSHANHLRGKGGAGAELAASLHPMEASHSDMQMCSGPQGFRLSK